jgi:hypothetical protein
MIKARPRPRPPQRRVSSTDAFLYSSRVAVGDYADVGVRVAIVDPSL